MANWNAIRQWLENSAATWAEAKAIAAKKSADKQDAAERAAIAKAFNDRYTFRREWVKGMPALTGTALYNFLPPSGYAWMCPVCNKIHHPLSCSVFSGLQYPACCGMFEGYRCGMGIKECD